MSIKTLSSDVFDFLFPRYCPVCGERLVKTESRICLNCLCNLPKTNAYLMKENPIEKLFWTFIPIERATSFFFYESIESHLSIYQTKYFCNPEVGEEMAEIMANEASEADFFKGIDFITPIPLHWKRKMKRGYNQSDYIARGISKATGLPVVNGIVKRIMNNSTQTRKGIDDRKTNVEGIFKLVKPELAHGKHILLVDDVITTGSTIISCGKELAKAGDVKLSVMSLGYAGRRFIV